jgi:hypothetical protein
MERNVEINYKHMQLVDVTVETVQMSVDEARAFIDGSLHDFDDLETCIDAAQGDVFSGIAPAAYVIIKIVK